MSVFLALMLMLMRRCLCLCASENSIRQISGFVLLMFLIMLTLMSRVFSLVMLLCASENLPTLGFYQTSLVIIGNSLCFKAHIKEIVGK